MTAIVLYGLRESLRRKMFAVVLVLTVGFLALYAWGAHAAFRDTRGFVGTGNENLDPDALTGAIVQGLAMFATLFLGAVLSVFLTLNVIRGDAEAGLLQPLVVRPVGRARLLVARFIGAAGVAALYVIGVYAATVAIADWAGGWTPDRIVAPGLELAAAVVVVSAIALAGSVFFAPIANGIGTLMVFGAGLIAGLLGEIGQAIQSGRLVVTHSVAVEEGAEFPLDSSAVTIGRAEQNDVAIDGDEFASARHARVEPRRDGVWVHDLGSTNGTFVNGVRIDRPRKLVNGDVVRAGETELRFEDA